MQGCSKGQHRAWRTRGRTKGNCRIKGGNAVSRIIVPNVARQSLDSGLPISQRAPAGTAALSMLAVTAHVSDS